MDDKLRQTLQKKIPDRTKKNGNLPKEATLELKKWILDHQEHPYPTESEKYELVKSLEITLNQVNNWFINARRRVLTSRPTTVRAKSFEIKPPRKKMVSSNSEVDKFERDSRLSELQTQIILLEESDIFFECHKKAEEETDDKDGSPTTIAIPSDENSDKKASEKNFQEKSEGNGQENSQVIDPWSYFSLALAGANEAKARGHKNPLQFIGFYLLETSNHLFFQIEQTNH